MVREMHSLASSLRCNHAVCRRETNRNHGDTVMTHFHRRHAACLLPLITAMLASSGMVCAQDQLSIPLIPATDDVVIDGGTVNESAAIESLLMPQDAATADTAIYPMPLEQFPPVDPQVNSELPPFNADEMAEEDRDDLLRGPVHEAFAEQVNSGPTSNMIVTLQPPAPVEELPPELKPNGREVEWISGYWAWDEDQDDFIWISGVWREIPQGFRWLPGYWTEVEGGFQWVSGTWVSTQTTEIQYLADAPPETLELGPVGVAPASDQIWIPGTWMWNDSRYAWRPGYWSTGYTDWVWIPARYQWTPRGYYHCHGYWDYPVNRRGVLFAPSYFNRRFRSNRITRFTPRVVVSTHLLTTHLWVRPRYRHYYFGNYYNVAYANRGLTPWYQYAQQRRAFDSLYTYYSRGQRSNAYHNQLSVQFNLFVNQPNRRPAITFRDQDRWQHDGRGTIRTNDLLGNRFQNLVDNSTRDRSGLQFVRLENQQREQVQQETRQLRDLGNQRREVERSLTQLQKLRDGVLKPQLHSHDTNRTDLRERLDRSIESTVSNGNDPKSATSGNPEGHGNHDSNHRPLSKLGDAKDAGKSNGDHDVNSRDGNSRDGNSRDGNSRDGNSRDGNSRDGKDGDVKGRGAVADSLRLHPRADASKGVQMGHQIENTARDVSKSGDDIWRRIGQKAETVKEQTANNIPNATARRIERDGSQERLKLPPTTRSIDAKASTGVLDAGKPSGANSFARDQMNRTESRVRSTIEGPVNDALKNTPAIRNRIEGRDRTPATATPAANLPTITRESSPRSTPATRPATRPAPTIQSTPAVPITPAPRSTPAARPAPAIRSTPAVRSTPTPNQGGGGSTRSSPSVSPPRGDTGGRVRSNPAPAASPGRQSGGAGGSGSAAAGNRGRGK
jgi:hypothetical protein